MFRPLALLNLAARASVAAHGQHALPVLGGLRLLSAVKAKKNEIAYSELSGLPRSFAREAAEHALAGVTPTKSKDGHALATFAAGCFWGVELHFQRIEGVVATTSGYVQGRVEKPTYEEVSAAYTGHTEAVQVAFDPKVVSYAQLLDAFWDRLGADATKHHQVGNDRGPQYRAGIYTVTGEQLDQARASLVEVSKRFKKGVTTEVEPMRGHFWPAEEYHQQYLEKGGRFGRPQSAAKGETETIRCYG
mmetsp:Transcript_27413/g.82275  ORF Transcript_27413/g.82275 Transcript_27413/m.82275 type:complete len:247 (-) Transcript_27413:28-768(-)